jgi:cyclophilin family peptidyl-prolyl cis-trans isomerase
MGQYSSQPEMTIDLAKTYSATLHTNHGDISIEFDAVGSPLTVNNWVFLARDGFYDGVIFHRVIKGFMIQGGDPTGTGMGGPGYKFRDELDGTGQYSRGTVAMANAGPNTNGSQFFIMHTDYGLPHNYSIFGQVTAGLEVVDAIANTPTGAQDRPHEDCVINSVTVEEA